MQLGACISIFRLSVFPMKIFLTFAADGKSQFKLPSSTRHFFLIQFTIHSSLLFVACFASFSSQITFPHSWLFYFQFYFQIWRWYTDLKTYHCKVTQSRDSSRSAFFDIFGFFLWRRIINCGHEVAGACGPPPPPPHPNIPPPGKAIHLDFLLPLHSDFPLLLHFDFPLPLHLDFPLILLLDFPLPLHSDFPLLLNLDFPLPLHSDFLLLFHLDFILFLVIFLSLFFSSAFTCRFSLFWGT